MGVINWERYRRVNGSINLILAFEEDDHTQDDLTEAQEHEGHEFLEAVEQCHPIVSRQAAAVALTAAFFFADLIKE